MADILGMDSGGTDFFSSQSEKVDNEWSSGWELDSVSIQLLHSKCLYVEEAVPVVLLSFYTFSLCLSAASCVNLFYATYIEVSGG